MRAWTLHPAVVVLSQGESRQRFATKAEARREAARFIDRYNTTRRHSSCEMRSPVDYEQLIATRAAKEEKAA
jgi:transposase InsO family protein